METYLLFYGALTAVRGNQIVTQDKLETEVVKEQL